MQTINVIPFEGTKTHGFTLHPTVHSDFQLLFYWPQFSTRAKSEKWAQERKKKSVLGEIVVREKKPKYVKKRNKQVQWEERSIVLSLSQQVE